MEPAAKYSFLLGDEGTTEKHKAEEANKAEANKAVPAEVSGEAFSLFDSLFDSLETGRLPLDNKVSIPEQQEIQDKETAQYNERISGHFKKVLRDFHRIPEDEYHPVYNPEPVLKRKADEADQPAAKRKVYTPDDVIISQEVTRVKYSSPKQDLDSAFKQLPILQLSDLFPEIKEMSTFEKEVRSRVGSLYLDIRNFFPHESEFTQELIDTGEDFRTIYVPVITLSRYETAADESVIEMSSIQKRRAELRKKYEQAAKSQEEANKSVETQAAPSDKKDISPIDEAIKYALHTKLNWHDVSSGVFFKQTKVILGTANDHALCAEVLEWIQQVERSSGLITLGIAVMETKRQLRAIESYLDKEFSDEAIQKKMKKAVDKDYGQYCILQDLEIKAYDIRGFRENLSETEIAITFLRMDFPNKIVTTTE